MDTWTNAKTILGEDVWWWLIPTQPTFKINYQERVFSKKEIVQMYRLNEFNEDPVQEPDEGY